MGLQVQEWLRTQVHLTEESRAILDGITGPEAVALDAEVLEAVEVRSPPGCACAAQGSVIART